MKLYPAIDIKSGQCVRLRHGRMDDVTIFNKDPAAQALAFHRTGFAYLHIVDLDGAIAGETRNGAAVSAIIEASNAEIQLGGGIRNRAQIDYWLDKGLSRVILGTAALHDPELVQSASRAYPGRIAVGIDTRAGYVSVSGWVEDSKITGLELAKRLEAAGIAAIIHTDIDRDGVLTGLNLDASLAIAQAVNIPIIASGGLAGLEDIQKLLQPEYSALEGAICGRALYDGRLDGAAALQLAARAGLDA